VFRELGRRLQRTGWGGSDVVATKLSKMILIKQYDPEGWTQYGLMKGPGCARPLGGGTVSRNSLMASLRWQP
jgi:hypothetical protein